MSKIEVFCVLGRHGAEYASILKTNFLKLASGKHDLLWRCITTGEFTTTPSGFQRVEHIRNYGQGSRTHGHGLNCALNAAREEFTLLADVDVAVLARNWDDMLVEELVNSEKNVVTIGTVYGGDKERGYLKFPNAIFMLTKTAALKRAAPDFRPITLGHNAKRVARYRVENPESAEIYGVPIDTILKYDTGWQVPLNFKRCGYKGLCFTWRRWEGRYIIFDYQGKPIVTHMTNSIRWGTSHKHYINWKNKIDVELERLGLAHV